jgi:Protein of unknown function (Gmx_para_CXXCG)
MKIYSLGCEAAYTGGDNVLKCRLPRIARCVCGQSDVWQNCWYPEYRWAAAQVEEMLGSIPRTNGDSITYEAFSKLRKRIIALVGESRWFPPGCTLGEVFVQIGWPGRKSVELEDTRRYEKKLKYEMLSLGFHWIYNKRAIDTLRKVTPLPRVFPINVRFLDTYIEGFNCIGLEPVACLTEECLKQWRFEQCEHCGWLVKGSRPGRSPKLFQFRRDVVERVGGLFRMRETACTACTEAVRDAIVEAKFKGVYFDELGVAQ